MAIQSQLEYRANLLTDMFVQPIVTATIEVAMWGAILASTGQTSFGGYSRESYLTYALWAAFFARIASNWMYEGRMAEEIESGSVNGILVRPISFYEYYLSQYMGYKLLTIGSILLPIAITLVFPGTADLSKLPLAIGLQLFYVILTHTMSFTVASLGFFLNRVFAFTLAKNLTIVMLTGELFPLDLAPEPFRSWLIALPFSAGVYLPVGYLTGRVSTQAMLNGFVSVGLGILIVGFFARILWLRGRRVYSGTGA